MFNYVKSLYDLIKWYFRTSKLRVRSKRNSTKTVIFSELNSSLVSVKVNTIYAKCLEYYGYRVLVIFKHKQLFYEQYYKCLGVNEFIYLDNNKTLAKNKIIDSIVKKTRNSDDFLKLEIEGINIGKWLASRIAKYEEQKKKKGDGVGLASFKLWKQ